MYKAGFFLPPAIDADVNFANLIDYRLIQNVIDFLFRTITEKKTKFQLLLLRNNNSAALSELPFVAKPSARV